MIFTLRHARRWLPCGRPRTAGPGPTEFVNLVFSSGYALKMIGTALVGDSWLVLGSLCRREEVPTPQGHMVTAWQENLVACQR